MVPTRERTEEDKEEGLHNSSEMAPPAKEIKDRWKINHLPPTGSEINENKLKAFENTILYIPSRMRCNQRGTIYHKLRTLHLRPQAQMRQFMVSELLPHKHTYLLERCTDPKTSKQKHNRKEQVPPTLKSNKTAAWLCSKNCTTDQASQFVFTESQFWHSCFDNKILAARSQPSSSQTSTLTANQPAAPRE